MVCYANLFIEIEQKRNLKEIAPKGRSFSMGFRYSAYFKPWAKCIYDV